MGWGVRKSLSEQMESPAFVSSSVVLEYSARREQPLWTRSVGDSSGKRIAFFLDVTAPLSTSNEQEFIRPSHSIHLRHLHTLVAEQ